MSITTYREEYRPAAGFEYPEFFEFYESAVGSVWRAEEVDMSSDLSDWRDASDEERSIIGSILNAFVLLETHISQYWATVIPQLFPKHEITSMAMAFAFFERIHAQGYAHLSDTLGTTDYAAFLADLSSRQKLDNFINCKNPRVSVAVFSAFGEGVSLYSSFAVLLNPTRFGKFRGLQQILSWSVNDEQQHSDAGCLLFRKLVDETGITKSELSEIYAAAEAVLEAEYSFLDNCFGTSEEIFGLAKEDLKEYLKYRVNDRLSALGLNPNQMYSREAVERISSWFHPMIMGVKANDSLTAVGRKNGDAYNAGFRFASSSIDMRKILLELGV
jgi:ribonucleoside-diphosphate reductase beta chain